jgi:predicted molibdopterin-dependent oxidoreductase YjgC
MTPRTVELTVDGKSVSVPEGTTLLGACQALEIDTPTMCWAENLTPVNVCRICVVEVEGSRVLVPACSRVAETGMKVLTDSPRVRLSRKLVIELLGSSVDMSRSSEFSGYAERYEARPERFGPRAESVAQPVKVDNDLFVRDYGRCMLCYKCVEACGTDAQNTFAIAVAGRGFDARIATEHEVTLPDSACVFCGNCVNACPTGALVFKAEHDLREAGDWRESEQTVTDTICPYCGVGCTLSLRVQDNKIVRVTSPSDSSVTAGNLCVKGRFGFSFVETPEKPKRPK